MTTPNTAKPDHVKNTPNHCARVRQLNDAFRTSFIGGQVVITSSIDHLPPSDRASLSLGGK